MLNIGEFDPGSLTVEPTYKGRELALGLWSNGIFFLSFVILFYGGSCQFSGEATTLL